MRSRMRWLKKEQEVKLEITQNMRAQDLRSRAVTRPDAFPRRRILMHWTGGMTPSEQEVSCLDLEAMRASPAAFAH